jgi:hypothetical protein
MGFIFNLFKFFFKMINNIFNAYYKFLFFLSVFLFSNCIYLFFLFTKFVFKYLLILICNYILIYMTKKIEIEYCGAWGWGGIANNLKSALQKAFAGVEVDCHSAGQKTSLVQVAWINNGHKNVVWSKGRQDTEKGHQ